MCFKNDVLQKWEKHRKKQNTKKKQNGKHYGQLMRERSMVSDVLFLFPGFSQGFCYFGLKSAKTYGKTKKQKVSSHVPCPGFQAISMGQCFLPPCQSISVTCSTFVIFAFLMFGKHFARTGIHWQSFPFAFYRPHLPKVLPAGQISKAC